MDVSKFNLFGVLFNFKDKKARDDHAALAETVGEHGTEIDGLKVPTFSEPAANANVREAVAKIKSGTAIGTLFTNVKAALNGLITLGEMRNYLVNNGTVTETGKYFLDAAYGKTLLDQITALNSNLGVVSTTLGNVVKPLTNTDIGAILGTMTRNASAIINDKLVCISVTILTPNDGIGIPADTPFFRINRKQVPQVCPVLTGGMQNAYVFTSITDSGDTVYHIRPGITQNTEIFMNFVGLVYR